MPGLLAAGPQGLLAPHGFCIICANCIGLAATGVGSAAVAAIAAAMVVRLPASSVDFSRLFCINCSSSTGAQTHDLDALDHFAAILIIGVQLFGGQRSAGAALQ